MCVCISVSLCVYLCVCLSVCLYEVYLCESDSVGGGGAGLCWHDRVLRAVCSMVVSLVCTKEDEEREGG